MTRARARRLAALGVCLAAAACARGPSRVLLGVALPENDHSATQLAVEEINAAGGIHGVPLQIEGLDWKLGGDSPAAVTLDRAAGFATNEELLGLIGHSDSASTLAAAPLYNEHGLPHLITIATHPAITRIGDFTYRLCPSDRRQAEVLAHHAVVEWGKREIAVFYTNDDYGKGLAGLFREAAEVRGARIVSSVLHRNLPTDEDRRLITSVLTRLQREGPPELFVLIQRMTAAEFTIERIRELGLDSEVLGSDSVLLLQSHYRGPALKRPLRAVALAAPLPEGPRGESFRRRIEARTGRSLDYSQAFAYDAVHLFAEAVRHGGFSREGVKGHLDRLIESGRTVSGVAGSYRLGTDHDARRDIYVVEFDGDGLRTIARYPPDGATAPEPG